jgi:hypothetical protein
MISFGPSSIDRMVRAVELVRERLIRSTSALEAEDISYAACGGNAVSAWVSRADQSAVRNTQDVDLVLRDEDYSTAASAMASAGFVHRRVASADLFLDGENGRERDSVKVHVVGRATSRHGVLPNPNIDLAPRLKALLDDPEG